MNMRSLSVEKRVAKSIAEVILKSVENMPRRERELRLKTFCVVLHNFLWPKKVSR